MKFRQIVASSALAAVMLGAADPSLALTFTVTGVTSKNENYCTSPLMAFLAEDCTYNRTFIQTFPDDYAWIGPIGGNGYYASDPGSYIAVPGPVASRSGIPVTGEVTITGSGATAQVSMDFTFGAKYRNYVTSSIGSATDGWTSIAHSFSGETVTTGVANGLGGYDYTIGVLPTLLLMRNTLEPFPADVGATPGVVAVPPVWLLPGAGGAPGIAAVEGNTSGVATTASVSGYTCAGECGSVIAWDTAAKAAFDNVLMRFRTDSSGNLVDGFAFLVQDTDVLGEFALPGYGLDSWNATTMTFSGAAAVVPVPAAVWLFGSGLGLLGWLRRRSVSA